jgi:hypothetical protein
MAEAFLARNTRSTPLSETHQLGAGWTEDSDSTSSAANVSQSVSDGELKYGASES